MAVGTGWVLGLLGQFSVMLKNLSLDWFMVSFIAAVAPSLFVLWLYRWRIAQGSAKAAPWRGLLVFWLAGAIAGLMAWGLEWGFEQVLQRIPGGRSLQVTLWGQMVRQFVGIAPIEEGCKLLAVMLPIWVWRGRSGSLPASRVLLAVLSVGLGFAAQEAVFAIESGRATVVDRTIGMPVHGLFSAAWGGAIARMQLEGERGAGRLWRGWLLGVAYHALSNSVATIVRVQGWIGGVYLLFAGWLWLGWQLERQIVRSLGQTPRDLTAGRTPVQTMGRLVLALLVLALGSGAISGLRDAGNVLVRFWGFPAVTLVNLGLSQELAKLGVRSVFLGAIAILLFVYLYRTAPRSQDDRTPSG